MIFVIPIQISPFFTKLLSNITRSCCFSYPPKLRDFGYNILYTPSASRFLDPYFALGFEVEKFDVTDVSGITTVQSKTDFVFETGIKLRGNVKYSPLKFLGVLSDFWGVRFGFKNKGYMKINEITYVIEIGAGVW